MKLGELYVHMSNALPTVLPRKICEVGFKHSTIHRYSIATMLHVIASCLHNNFILKILLSV